MCIVLGLSKSGYYKRKKTGKGKREKREELLLEKIKEIYLEYSEVYGSPCITAELK